MLILDSGCGWIPDAPIKFMYHIINLIKNLTPVILIIMGSLDFGKAVMSQKEDEIKKAQGAFIKKIIAGAAVFFTIVFARWIVKIVDNAGGNSGNAWSCVSFLLNGSYSADDKTYYDGPNKTTSTTTESYRSCYNKCMKIPDTTAQNKCLETCQIPTTGETNDQQTCINKCITDYTNGTYVPKYVNKGTIIAECKKAFDYDNGEYGKACQRLEDCVEGYNGNTPPCEEITSANLNGKCSSEYQDYQNYYNKYGSAYADDPTNACQQYADNYLKNNIEQICKNECMN